jgi:hypothetical protein
MALVIKDRVKEVTTTSGTGAVTLLGATTGYQSFTSAVGNGNTTYYAIVDNTTGDWEVGLGTYTTSTTSLSRDTVLSSSNSGSLVTFTSNSKDVFVTYPAGKGIYQDSIGNVGIGTTSPTTKLTISANTILPSAGAITGTGLWQVGADATASNILLDSFGSALNIIGRRSQGTAASPSSVTSNINLLQFQAYGYGATAYSSASRVSMSMQTSQAWTDTAQGTQILFSTTTNNTAASAERMRIHNSGGVSIGNTTDPSANNLSVTGGLTLGTALSVANGGTGTATAFTEGSVVFAGASGVYSQNNTNFFWDNTNSNLGINTTTPAATLEVVSAATNPFVFNTSYSTLGTITAAFIGRHARGSQASPTATQLGDNIASYGGRGYGATAFAGTSRANFRIIASENWTDTAQGTYFTYTTTATGTTTTTEKMRLTDAGNLGIGTTAPIDKLDVLTTIWGRSSGTTSAGVVGAAANNYSSLPSYRSTYLVQYDSAYAGTLLGLSYANLGALAFQNTSAALIYTNGANPLVFGTNSAERMRIDSAGNVGIGTTSPTTYLDVGVNSSTSGGINCGAFSSSAYSATGVIPSIQSFGARNDGNQTFQGRFGAAYRRTDGTAITSATNIGMYAFGGQWGVDTSYQSAKLLYTASISGVAEGSFTSATAMPTAITFRTGSTGDLIGSPNLPYGTERMRIDSAGNVGIGTTSPAVQLDVYNATSSVLSVDGDSNTSIRSTRYSTDTTAPALNFRKARGTKSSPTTVATGDFIVNLQAFAHDGTTFRTTATIASQVETYTTTDNLSGNLIFSTRPTGVAATTLERMRIHASGGVSIGNTTDPSANNLSVTGTLTLGTALSVANGGTGTGTAGITAFNNITGYTASGATGTTSTNLVFSTSPTFTTSIDGGATFAAFASPTTLTLGAGATTGTFAYNGTGTATTNIATGATASTFTNTVNVGTNGATGSTTTITIGSTAGTSSVAVKGTSSYSGLATFSAGLTVAAGQTTTLGGPVNMTTVAAITMGGASGTGTITLGQSTVSQTTNIQAGITASGSTKTINIGTNGASGSTTTIIVGGTAGTSTTTLNGTTSIIANGVDGVNAATSGLTANTTVTNTATYTTAGLTLATQTAAAGSVWRVRAYGQFTAASSATVRTAQIACFWGTTQLTAITPTVLASAAQTTQWQVEFELSATSTTAMWTTGSLINRIASATLLAVDNATPASTTVTSGAQTLDLQVRVSSAIAAESWIIQQITMERIK